MLQHAQRILARNHENVGEIGKKRGVNTAKCLRKIEHGVFGDLL